MLKLNLIYEFFVDFNEDLYKRYYFNEFNILSKYYDNDYNEVCYNDEYDYEYGEWNFPDFIFFKKLNPYSVYYVEAICEQMKQQSIRDYIEICLNK